MNEIIERLKKEQYKIMSLAEMDNLIEEITGSTTSLLDLDIEEDCIKQESCVYYVPKYNKEIVVEFEIREGKKIENDLTAEEFYKSCTIEELLNAYVWITNVWEY